MKKIESPKGKSMCSMHIKMYNNYLCILRKNLRFAYCRRDTALEEEKAVQDEGISVVKDAAQVKTFASLS